MLKRMKKKNIFLSLFLILIFGIISFRVLNSFNVEDSKEEKLSKVSLLNLEEHLGNKTSLNLVGQVESIQKVDLQSEAAGKIKRLNIEIGQNVKKGQILAELDHSILDSQLVQAQANIERIQNSLELKLAGASDEVIRQSEVQLEKIESAGNLQLSQAKSALEIAENKLQNLEGEDDSQIIKSSYENLANSIHASIIVLDNVKNTSDSILALENYFSRNNFENVFSVLDISKLNKTERSFREMSTAISDVKTGIDNLSTSFSNQEILAKASDVKKVLSISQNHFYDLEAALNATITSAKLSQAELDQTKAKVSSASNSLSSVNQGITVAIQNISNSKSSYDSLKIAYQKAKEDYNNLEKQIEKDMALAKASHEVVTAKPRELDINSLKSSIKEAQAAYNIIRENRDKAILRAPIDGVIASVDVSMGNFVGNGTLMASILSDEGLQIKTYIDHNDLISVSKGQEVVIEQTLAKGVVDRVSPMINDKTKKIEIIILVSSGADNLVSGQHANIELIIDQSDNSEENFYYLPLASVKTTKDGSFVYTVGEDSRAEAIAIVTGQIIGDKIEVFGLSDLDYILASVRGISVGDKISIQ